ncbi:MAG: MBL fold metallo-hydrolase [Novosphingobium sp.]|nr:MBL fold metallo-hydrolase [Novosphingobium sp.]MBO9600974.1 MBL fold metallo-hydrolase [Novosphingobium sp.]
MAVVSALANGMGVGTMFFESFKDGEGCKSYIVACEETCSAAIIDPALGLVDRYIGQIAMHGLRVRYIVDTHTHADHFSGAQALKAEFHAPIVMHRFSPSPYVDLHVEDGHTLPLGELRMRIFHVPGHTRDSMAVHIGDRVFTGDTLLIGGTGRSDLPSGDADQLYDSCSASCWRCPTKRWCSPRTTTRAASIRRSATSARTTHGCRRPCGPSSSS